MRLETTTAQQILEFSGSTRAMLALILSRYTRKLSERRCPDINEYPTKFPCVLMNCLTVLSSCSSDKGENPVTSCSPSSATRHCKVQCDTRSILVISVQQRPSDRRLSRTSSGTSSLSRPLSPFLSTFGPTSEYRARWEHVEELLPIHCLCNW